MNPIQQFSFVPNGPFNLLNQTEYFGEWISPANDPKTVVIIFPVEGWQGSSAVLLSQTTKGIVEGRIFGPARQANMAKEQALSRLSLDVNGEGWPDVGKRDYIIGRLQQKYECLRPVLFNSPYEAAAAFIIGHRISIKQRITIMARLSDDIGEKIFVEGEYFKAFPLPSILLSLQQFRGLNEVKIGRLHAVANAAVNGLLDRKKLREMPLESALSSLRDLPGIGPFFAQGILYRGAGLADTITDDDVSRYAIKMAYGLSEPPDKETVLRIAEAWRPFRMWALVLLHIWIRREVGLPKMSALGKY